MIIIDEKAKKEYLYYIDSIENALHIDNIYNRKQIEELKKLILNADMVLSFNEYERLCDICEIEKLIYKKFPKTYKITNLTYISDRKYKVSIIVKQQRQIGNDEFEDEDDFLNLEVDMFSRTVDTIN